MWRLTTFGGLSIERLEQTEPNELDSTLPRPTPQRRPLALLAVLATAGARGVCRDDVLLYFWPDSDVERARNALRQTLFRLRRDLGPHDPVIGTVDLRLDPAVITSDVAEFEDALARGELERAVTLHRGAFLHGVSIGTLPEFDQWAAAERARLTQQFSAAVESLAQTAHARGDHIAAIGWWRRLAAADATNDRAAAGLMTALAASGDREGALQYYRLHELLLREELGITEEQTVEALVDRLAHGRPEIVANSAGAARTSASTADAGTHPPARRVRQKPLRLALGVAVALVVVAAIGRAASERKSRMLAARVSSDVIAVLPFTTRGDTSIEALGVAVSDLLSAAIDGAGGLRVADRRAVRESVGSGAQISTNVAQAQAIAVRHGAGKMVLGEVMRSGERLSITATVYEHGASPRRLAELAVTGRRDDIATVTNQLARQLLASTHSGPTGNLIRSAAATTTSLAAFRAYLDGERRFQNGDFAPAMEAFQRAVHEDTTFAIAYYRLAIAADWASHPTLPADALGGALRLVNRVPEHDQQLIRALDAWRQGRGAEALQRYRLLVAQYPADAEAWYQLGEVLFHAGPAYGHPVLEARPAFERALHFRPGARESLIHLVRLAAKAGDARAVDSFTQRVLAMDSTKDVIEMRLFRALTGHNEAGARRVIETLRTSPDEAVLTAAWRGGVFAEDLVHAKEIARLLMDPSRGPVYQTTGRWYVASLELARGRWKAARAVLAPGFPTQTVPNAGSVTRSDASPPGSALGIGSSVDAFHAGHLGLMAALPMLSLPPSELSVLRERVTEWPEPPPGMANWANLFQPRMRDYILGLLSLRAGDTTAALRHADRLDRLTGEGGITPIARGASLALRAAVERAGGRREKALALLEAAPVVATLSSVMQSRAYDRFLRAELLRELGRDDDALRWYATQGQSFVPDLIYLAPAHLRQAEIYDRRGDVAKAVAHYQRFVELWRDAEPELQSPVATARNRIRVLGAQ